MIINSNISGFFELDWVDFRFNSKTMGAKETRMDVEAFVKAFRNYLTIKYKMSHTRTPEQAEKDALASIREFTKDVSNTAGNPQVFHSLQRRYKQMFKDFETVFLEEFTFSPGEIKELKTPEIKIQQYPYTINDVLAKTHLNNDKPIRKWAKTEGAVDCINLKKTEDGNDIFRFSDQGINDLLSLIKPRPHN